MRRRYVSSVIQQLQLNASTHLLATGTIGRVDKFTDSAGDVSLLHSFPAPYAFDRCSPHTFQRAALLFLNHGTPAASLVAGLPELRAGCGVGALHFPSDDSAEVLQGHQDQGLRACPQGFTSHAPGYWNNSYPRVSQSSPDLQGHTCDDLAWG